MPASPSNVRCSANRAGHITTIIEAPEGKSLAEQLLPRVHLALRSFAAPFKIEYGDTAQD